MEPYYLNLAEKYRNPLQLVFAENDKQVPFFVVARFRAIFRDAKFVTIQNATHFVIVQEPERVSRLLLDFFEDNKSSP